MKPSDQTLANSVMLSDGKIWRPVRDTVEIDPTDDQIQRLQQKVLPAPAGSVTIVAGAPGNLSSISAAQSPVKQQDRTYSLVSVTFTVIPDPSYSSTRVWVVGYKGNSNPVLQTEAPSGPINFLLESTGESVTLIGQPVSQDGTVINLSACLSATVVLSGVVTAPPAPSISQTLVAIPVGYQFAYNQLNLGATQDVIDSYRIYRNTSNTFAGASLLQVNKHDPTNSNAVVVQDLTGSGVTYYYFVTSVNTVGLESASTAAQSGTVNPGNPAVDSSGNILLKNISNGAGSTSDPTTTSTTYVVIPEMTTTITTKGNKVAVIFSGTFLMASVASGLSTGFVALFRDGAQISGFVSKGTQSTDTVESFTLAVAWIDSPSAGSHTYDARWLRNVGGSGGTFQSVGTNRQIQAVELG